MATNVRLDDDENVHERSTDRSGEGEACSEAVGRLPGEAGA